MTNHPKTRENPATDTRRERSREYRPPERITCGGCDNTWTGKAAAHCSVCHETFASVTQFDQHRRETGERGRCLKPAEVLVQRGPRKGERVMFQREDGVWRGPEMSDEARASFGSAS